MLSLLLRLNCFCKDIIIGRGWWCNISVCTTLKYLLFQMTMTIYHTDPYLLNISIYELSIFLILSFLIFLAFFFQTPLKLHAFCIPKSLEASTHYIHKCNQFYKAQGDEHRALGKLALQRPHVISLMKKHENNLYSFKKFAAVFSVEFRSLGRPEEHLETSWNMLLPGSSSIILWDCHLFDY